MPPRLGWPWAGRAAHPKVPPLVGGHWAQLCRAIVQARCGAPAQARLCCTSELGIGVFDRAAEVVLFGLWLR